MEESLVVTTFQGETDGFKSHEFSLPGDFVPVAEKPTVRGGRYELFCVEINDVLV